MANIVTDAFSGSSGDALQTYTANWVRHTLFNGATNTAYISNAGRARRGNTSQILYYRSETPSSANYSVSADFHVVSNNDSSPGIVGRLDTSTETCYLARWFQGNWRISRLSSGSSSTVAGDYAQSLSVGVSYNVRLEMVGSAIKLYVDGVERLSGTNGDITAIGKAGIRMTGGTGDDSDTVGFHWDNFSADDAGGASTVPPGILVPSFFGFNPGFGR